MLGAAWAYHVLGWGGYWGWDPVENASLLPWLSGTAFLHSVMMQEKKGMMKVWNMVLISTTFFLCILGTFMTRSRRCGIRPRLREVRYRQVLRGLPGGGHRRDGLSDSRPAALFKSESQLESVVSRESSFLFNNLILLASCFAVLWGTLFPTLSGDFLRQHDLARWQLVQPPDGAHRPVPAAAHRSGSAVRVAEDFA